ncbi:MAG: hypothetical protein HYV63_03750 [Candidatus Schekmanbacteria bacterium]|nr:hypothetical protein [Candidatus Schekmanbacteria bacterium]
MSGETALRPVADEELVGLVVRRAGEVDLRRDIFQVARYAKERGIRMTKRENTIPRTDARRLAKLLSRQGEDTIIEQEGFSEWAEYVLRVARDLGVVEFDIEGIYAGYTSDEPCFPDNDVVVKQREWDRYLGGTPTGKEQALLDVLVKTTPNEFFARSLLIPQGVFSSFGSGLGPASRMNLSNIRRRLLELLATLPAAVWYELTDLIDLIQLREPNLILDPATRREDPSSRAELERWTFEKKRQALAAKGARGKVVFLERPAGPRPEIRLESIYCNFHEGPAGDESHQERQPIPPDAPDGFRRVEGRYLEWFLAGIPFLCGFVDLAYRADNDDHGREMRPYRERLRAVRLTAKLRQVVTKDPALDRVAVTVLPTHEVIVEAPSYPDCQLAVLARYCELRGEDRPVYRLRLDRKRIIGHFAAAPVGAPSAVVELGRLTDRPIPPNVVAELEAWSGHAEKLLIFENAAVVELHDAAKRRGKVCGDLGELLVTAGPAHSAFIVARDPLRVYAALEALEHVPLLVQHDDRELAAAPAPSKLAPQQAHRDKRRPAQAEKVAPQKVGLQAVDIVGYRSSVPELMRAVQERLQTVAGAGALVGDDLLVLPAAALPALRRVINELSEQYDVELL